MTIRNETLAHAAFSPARRRRSLGDLMGLFRQRQALARLDDAALEDIGFSRAEAEAEAARPVWDVPTHWTR